MDTMTAEHIKDLEDELGYMVLQNDLLQTQLEEAEELIKVLKAHLQRVHRDIQYPISGVA